MSYQPVVPMTGNAGWAFLTRTRGVQQEAFESSAQIKRDTDHFRENIGKITSVEDLMKDRRLLTVALGAFGLDDDINKKFLVGKVLSEGAEGKEALANKLNDGRYISLAKTFGFDKETPNTLEPGFADRLVEQFKTRRFEVAVGEQDVNMRYALGLGRELDTLLAGEKSDNTMWYAVMATKPLRAVFEAALGLPKAVGALDVDRQLEIFKEKSQRNLGSESPRVLEDPAKREELLRMFFARSDIEASMNSFSPASVALSLLQSMPRPDYGF